MRRLLVFSSAALLVLGFMDIPDASAQQSVNFYVGGFTPRGADARSTDDVLVRNLNFLTFKIDDFNGGTLGGEYVVGLGNFLDAGLSLGFYQRTSPVVYTSFVNADRTEIEQDLKLRIVPVTATVRFLPLGRHTAIQPYIGGGVGVFGWRYSETGQFVDFTDPDRSIFRDNFVASGSATGPVVLGGVRVMPGSVGLGGEIRYQSAEGSLPASKGFAGSKIDLGGFAYLFTVNVMF